MTERHPLHGVGILVYQCREAEPDRQFIAMFSEYRGFPIYSPRPTKQEAYDAALAWQNEAIQAFEFAYVQRVKAIARARESKARGQA